MRRSFGTGSPIYFHCPVARRNQIFDGWGYRQSGGGSVRNFYRYPPGHDEIVRTGATKPRPRTRTTPAIGTRQMHTSHQYRCECGHVGWTTHQDILRYPIEEAT